MRRARRLAVFVACAIAPCAMFASAASAHTWSLEKDFALSPDGVTAPANPFADSYTNSGVWAAGFGGGGAYTTTTETTYSGLTQFEVAPSADWQVIGPAGVEGWRGTVGGDPFPIVAVNGTTETADAAWPAETVIFHPGAEGVTELSRGAARWVSPITGTISIEASFADVDCGGGDGIDYSVDRQDAGSSTFTHLAGKVAGYCGSGSYSSGPLSVTAGDAYYFSVGDGGNGEKNFDSTGVTVNITDGAAETLSINAPANLTATHNQAMTPANVSGADSDGDAVTLSAANVPAGLSFNASTGVLSGKPTVPMGRYVITFAANDGHGETVTKHTVVTVEQGLCTLTNKPAALAKPAGQTFTVKMTETGTKTAIVGREVVFGVESLFFGTAITSSTGVAKVKAKLPEGGVYFVNAEFRGDGSYQPCAVAKPELVTVESATWTATGAGQVAGTAQGIGKTTATVGFNAAATGENEQPVVRLTVPGVNFYATNIVSLTKPTATSATWSGSGNWNGGSAEYTITAVDPGTGADTVSITITVGGETVFSTEGARNVTKGDAKVH